MNTCWSTSIPCCHNGHIDVYMNASVTVYPHPFLGISKDSACGFSLRVCFAQLIACVGQGVLAHFVSIVHDITVNALRSFSLFAQLNVGIGNYRVPDGCSLTDGIIQCSLCWSGRFFVGLLGIPNRLMVITLGSSDHRGSCSLCLIDGCTQCSCDGSSSSFISVFSVRDRFPKSALSVRANFSWPVAD